MASPGSGSQPTTRMISPARCNSRASCRRTPGSNWRMRDTRRSTSAIRPAKVRAAIARRWLRRDPERAQSRPPLVAARRAPRGRRSSRPRKHLAYAPRIYAGCGVGLVQRRVLFRRREVTSLRIVEPYVAALRRYLGEVPEPVNLVDLGCGDFNVGRRLIDVANQTVACDVVPDLIARNRSRFVDPRVTFRVVDAVSDELPEGNVVCVRQVLQHLTNEQIETIVRKLQRYSTWVITEHLPRGDFVPNRDKRPGRDIRIDACGSGVGLDRTSVRRPPATREGALRSASVGRHHSHRGVRVRRLSRGRLDPLRHAHAAQPRRAWRVAARMAAAGSTSAAWRHSTSCSCSERSTATAWRRPSIRYARWCARSPACRLRIWQPTMRRPLRIVPAKLCHLWRIRSHEAPHLGRTDLDTSPRSCRVGITTSCSPRDFPVAVMLQSMMDRALISATVKVIDFDTSCRSSGGARSAGRTRR